MRAGTNNKTLRVGSLFSGIGGLDLGLERAGMTVAWQSEIDPYCCKVLAKHWPDVPNLGDVTRIEWSEVERVDLICGGFPCQPFSAAGYQRGLDDERWMWPYFADAVRALRPQLVVVENVPTLVADGAAFGWLLRDLHSIGFDAEWDVLPASAFGAPHRRERLFLVAHAAGAGLEGGFFAPIARPAQRQLPDRLGRPGASWPSPPRVPRVGYGSADWVDRVRVTGNAVVPQVAEWIGAQLLTHVEQAA